MRRVSRWRLVLETRYQATEGPRVKQLEREKANLETDKRRLERRLIRRR